MAWILMLITSVLPVNRPQPESFDPFAAVNERIGDFAFMQVAYD